MSHPSLTKVTNAFPYLNRNQADFQTPCYTHNPFPIARSSHRHPALPPPSSHERLLTERIASLEKEIDTLTERVKVLKKEKELTVAISFASALTSPVPPEARDDIDFVQGYDSPDPAKARDIDPLLKWYGGFPPPDDGRIPPMSSTLPNAVNYREASDAFLKQLRLDEKRRLEWQKAREIGKRISDADRKNSENPRPVKYFACYPKHEVKPRVQDKSYKPSNLSVSSVPVELPVDDNVADKPFSTAASVGSAANSDAAKTPGAPIIPSPMEGTPWRILNTPKPTLHTFGPSWDIRNAMAHPTPMTKTEGSESGARLSIINNRGHEEIVAWMDRINTSNKAVPSLTLSDSEVQKMKEEDSALQRRLPDTSVFRSYAESQYSYDDITSLFAEADAIHKAIDEDFGLPRDDDDLEDGNMLSAQVEESAARDEPALSEDEWERV